MKRIASAANFYQGSGSSYLTFRSRGFLEYITFYRLTKEIADGVVPVGMLLDIHDLRHRSRFKFVAADALATKSKHTMSGPVRAMWASYG